MEIATVIQFDVNSKEFFSPTFSNIDIQVALLERFGHVCFVSKKGCEFGCNLQGVKIKWLVS